MCFSGKCESRDRERTNRMCGINGIVNYREKPIDNILGMNEAILHRGPDAGDYYLDEQNKVVLGHRRLSILDLSENGAQPMRTADDRYVICYNGEIYNHAELLDTMYAEGFRGRLKGTSDTEILIEAIAFWGLRRTLDYVKGMFALALYDRLEEKLYLTRDRVGEKPLYYGMVDGSFVFASDIGSIRSLTYFRNSVNHDVLGLYLQYGYIPAPYSIYTGICKLCPGTVLRLDIHTLQFTTETYYDMRSVAFHGEQNPFSGTREEAADRLEKLLQDTVRGQMISDVPLGAFLSGGIDSSLVVSMMQSVSDRPVKTFTIGFDVEKYNEAEYAKDIARHLGTDHTELYVGQREAFDVIHNLSKAYTEPFADSSQIPTMLVSRMTREHVTVSLSGDGGDELFCGYSLYQGAASEWKSLQKRIGKIPMKRLIGKCAGALSGNNDGILYKLGNYLTIPDMETAHWRNGLENGTIFGLLRKKCENPIPFGKKKLIACSNTEYQAGMLKAPEHNLMLMDLLQYHPDDILVKVDRAGMFYSLETRIPLLDRDVMDFAWSLPLSYKMSRDENGKQITKRVMRDVLYRHVPREMMERPKKGFSVPLSTWLREGELNEWATQLLQDGRGVASEYINTKQVDRMWADYLQYGKWTEKIWYLLMLYQWMTEYLA